MSKPNHTKTDTYIPLRSHRQTDDIYSLKMDELMKETNMGKGEKSLGENRKTCKVIGDVCKWLWRKESMCFPISSRWEQLHHCILI